jgi:hypothetical protein
LVREKNFALFPLPASDAKIVATLDRLREIENEMPLARFDSDRHRLENEKTIFVDRLDDEVFGALNLTTAQGAFVWHAAGRQ